MSEDPSSRHRFLEACRRRPTDVTPVWFMRQAGRYMPEYRALREKYSLLEICRRPELVREVTLQPIAAMDLDAAIIFGDIMLPLEGLGIDYDIVSGVGPVVEEPVRSRAQVEAMRPFDPEESVPWFLEGIRQTREAVDGRVPLIGFCGAPFTLASYLIEGKGSRSLRQTKALMFGAPEIWDELMARLADALGLYLAAQVEAGAQAVQVFDSWVGALGPEDYRRYAGRYTSRVFDAVAHLDVPTIHFGTCTATILAEMRQAGGDVVGADWRIPLDQAWRIIGHDRAIQGNLDPGVLFADFDTVREHAFRVLRQAGGRRGHVFNLGHGILPETPVDNVRRLVDLVHDSRLEGNGSE